MRVALVLAGGEGRRFGRRDKLLEPLGGVPLLLHALRRAYAAAPRTLLILPPGFARRRALVAALRWPKLRVHVARDARQGLGASITAGLARLRPIDREIALFLADMPFVSAPARRLPDGLDVVRPFYRDIPGHPLLLRASAVRGRRVPAEGKLATLIDRRRLHRTVGRAGHTIDVDTPAALRRLRRRIATRAGAFRIATSSGSPTSRGGR